MMPRCGARHNGFSLIELVAVLTLVGVLGFVALFQSDPRYTAVLSARDDLIAALERACASAMARDSAANPVRLIVTSTSVAVTEAGVAQTLSGVTYPLSVPHGVSISPPLTLEFDKLGQTAATTFTVTDGTTSATVEVSASGYAR